MYDKLRKINWLGQATFQTSAESWEASKPSRHTWGGLRKRQRVCADATLDIFQALESSSASIVCVQTFHFDDWLRLKNTGAF